LTVGKSFGANQESTLMPSITDLVDTTGTTGFKGALGFNENAFSTGSGSVFTFRLGGDTDVFSITFDTLGQQNFGADLVDISSVNVATQGGAAAAITILEEALESVSTTQTKIGAGINHMQRRINVLETHREALQAQKARIEEIDFTEETRTLASLQILLQSSTAALAQANIIPQTLLQLLA
jgi:flagellin